MKFPKDENGMIIFPSHEEIEAWKKKREKRRWIISCIYSTVILIISIAALLIAILGRTGLLRLLL